MKFSKVSVVFITTLLREAAKKVLSGQATKRVGGAKRLCHEGKNIFFFNVKKKVPMATKLRRGGGLKALGVGPIRKDFFWGFP